MSFQKYLKYSLYILPGYGIYKEIKKPREKRKIHHAIGWVAYSSGALFKLAILPSYILFGVETGNWNPINHTEILFKSAKEKIENIFEKKENKLEKSLKVE
jgi:hypothetical protein